MMMELLKRRAREEERPLLLECTRDLSRLDPVADDSIRGLREFYRRGTRNTSHMRNFSTGNRMRRLHNGVFFYRAERRKANSLWGSLQTRLRHASISWTMLGGSLSLCVCVCVSVGEYTSIFFTDRGAQLAGTGAAASDGQATATIRRVLFFLRL
jgi:hypothetical protein